MTHANLLCYRFLVSEPQAYIQADIQTDVQDDHHSSVFLLPLGFIPFAKAATSGNGRGQVRYIREWQRPGPSYPGMAEVSYIWGWQTPNQLHPGLAETKSVTLAAGFFLIAPSLSSLLSNRRSFFLVALKYCKAL